VSEAEGKSVRLEDFQEILSSAGLTLAATNPEKLKAAQEAAANAPVAPRIPRERKAVLPTADAPLIQVETHR
jgi:ribonuclease E